MIKTKNFDKMKVLHVGTLAATAGGPAMSTYLHYWDLDNKE